MTALIYPQRAPLTVLVTLAFAASTLLISCRGPTNRLEDPLAPLLRDGKRVLLLKQSEDWGFFCLTSSTPQHELVYGTLRVDRANGRAWTLGEVIFLRQRKNHIELAYRMLSGSDLPRLGSWSDNFQGAVQLPVFDQWEASLEEAVKAEKLDGIFPPCLFPTSPAYGELLPLGGWKADSEGYAVREELAKLLLPELPALRDAVRAVDPNRRGDFVVTGPVVLLHLPEAKHRRNFIIPEKIAGFDISYFNELGETRSPGPTAQKVLDGARTLVLTVPGEPFKVGTYTDGSGAMSNELDGLVFEWPSKRFLGTGRFSSSPATTKRTIVTRSGTDQRSEGGESAGARLMQWLASKISANYGAGSDAGSGPRNLTSAAREFAWERLAERYLKHGDTWFYLVDDAQNRSLYERKGTHLEESGPREGVQSALRQAGVTWLSGVLFRSTNERRRVIAPDVKPWSSWAGLQPFGAVGTYPLQYKLARLPGHWFVSYESYDMPPKSGLKAPTSAEVETHLKDEAKSL